MPRDLPDWLAQNAQATVGEVTDLGELAARLGSIVTFDRRGDVVALENFESGFSKVASSISGTGAAVDLSFTSPRSGIFSCRLRGGSTGTGLASVTMRRPTPSLSLWGFEFSFVLPNVADRITWTINRFDGSTLHQFAVEWDDLNNRIEYLNAAGGFTVLASDIELTVDSALYHTGKLVVNPANDQYVHFVLNETTYSMAGIAAFSQASTVPALVEAVAQVNSRGGQNNTIYADDLIYTHNEPA